MIVLAEEVDWLYFRNLFRTIEHRVTIIIGARETINHPAVAIGCR